ncbi:MAG: A/G-specific adenine glycosylase [Pseudomonadales bacterium]|nr:A/G-specific adenine glycosylase [Pseudomonadales bacterium]
MGPTFADRLLAWHQLHGRHDLPWQHPRSPYRVWLSEIMLQQTQVQTVIPYFERFVRHYPDLAALADAAEDDVLHLWSGLGYYSRARNLHRAARLLVERFNGDFPDDAGVLESLPGIGRSTAAAIVAQAFGRRAPILDGNVKRVLARHNAVDGFPGDSAVASRLWECAEAVTPDADAANFTQAIMDLGATVCTRTKPRCNACPVSADCRAFHTGRSTDYPGRKPRRALPEKASLFALILRADGACLLERRPPEGVWGGLWSPPELPLDTTTAALAHYLGAGDLEAEDGAPAAFIHTFSHFRLRVEPRLYRVTGANATHVRDVDTLLWYKPDAGQRIGLSAVASRLLQALETRTRI